MPAESETANQWKDCSQFYTIPSWYPRTSCQELHAYGINKKVSHGHGTRFCLIHGRRFKSPVEMTTRRPITIMRELVGERIEIPRDEPGQPL